MAPWHLRCAIAASLVAALDAGGYGGYQVMPPHGQCKNPLYQTQWAGKNDIQTLRAFPTVKTNLKRCPAYNQMASCCDQTFESEQTKYYTFWKQILSAKLARADVHRRSVAALDVGAVDSDSSSATSASRREQAQREQWQLALERYAAALDPAQHSECFSSLLTYVAGMICFSCKPNWFHYTLMSGDTIVGEHVVRVRIRAAACVEIWAACGSFAAQVSLLRAALRDSVVARRAVRSEEDLSMFTEQQLLCDWMHDQVGLHPFRLPTKEEGDTALHYAKAAGATSTSSSAGSAVSGRRLEMRMELDVMHDGRASGFNRNWVGALPPITSSCRAPSSSILWRGALAFVAVRYYAALWQAALRAR